MAAKMRYAAKDMGLDVSITARAESEIPNLYQDADVIMVGPHLSGYYEDLKSRYGTANITLAMNSVKPPFSFFSGTNIRPNLHSATASL